MTSEGEANENSRAATAHQSGEVEDVGASDSADITNSNSGIKRSRSLSISEQASAGSTRRCSPPWFLRFLELPFRVKNNQTGQYLEEATGQGMDMAARGAINQTGGFIGSAMIRMAALDAGGPNEKIYGIRASSVLTVASIIVGVTAGVTMPVLGALVDHTNHRKIMGGISAGIVALAVGCQLILNKDTWFAVFILEIIGGYFLIMHQVCTMAYLPDLTHENSEMGHYTAWFMMIQYGIQGLFTSIVIAVSFPLNYTNLQTAKLAAAMAFGVGTVLLGYAWIFLFRKRPKLREVPKGANMITTEFKQLYSTFKNCVTKYRALKWFMIALLFSPEAGAGVILSIAVTFLTFFARMSVREIAIVSLTMIFSNIPGAYLSKVMCKKVNPLNSFRMAEVAFAVVNALLVGTVTGATQRDKNLIYFYGALIGVAFGWMFPSQRTLAVALIPKGQEMEIMGLISFFGQIFGWLPALVFTAMNERGINMRWGLGSVSFFLMASFFCTLLCGSYDEAVEQVKHTSEIYLQEFSQKSKRDSFAVSESDAADDGLIKETSSKDDEKMA